MPSIGLVILRFWETKETFWMLLKTNGRVWSREVNIKATNHRCSFAESPAGQSLKRDQWPDVLQVYIVYTFPWSGYYCRSSDERPTYNHPANLIYFTSSLFCRCVLVYYVWWWSLRWLHHLHVDITSSRCWPGVWRWHQMLTTHSWGWRRENEGIVMLWWPMTSKPIPSVVVRYMFLISELWNVCQLRPSTEKNMICESWC